MVAVARNQLAQLFQSIFHDVGIGLGAHFREGVRTPCRNFALHQYPVTVAVLENSPVLGPMGARENTIQMFQVGMIACYPVARFCHSELWITACHAFHTHQPHPLAVQVKLAIFDL